MRSAACRVAGATATVTSLGSLAGPGRQQLGARRAAGAVAGRGRQQAGTEGPVSFMHDEAHASHQGNAGENAIAAKATSAAKRRTRDGFIAVEYATPGRGGQEPARPRRMEGPSGGTGPRPEERFHDAG